MNIRILGGSPSQSRTIQVTNAYDGVCALGDSLTDQGLAVFIASVLAGRQVVVVLDAVLIAVALTASQQLFLGCTDQLTAEYVSQRTGIASVAVSSTSKALSTLRVSDYTPQYRESSGVGKRPVLTPDEVLRLPVDEALVILRGHKVLKVHKMDYSLHPAYKQLRECKASAHIPECGKPYQKRSKLPQWKQRHPPRHRLNAVAVLPNQKQ